MTKEELKAALCAAIEKRLEDIRAIGMSIAEEPELGYKEFQASAKLKELLRSWGFRIEENVCGLETAFKAYWDAIKGRAKK